MAVQNCPLCGSRVEIPRVETNNRYTCNKCHSPFHLNKGGTAVVGAPPTIDVELAESKQKLQEILAQIPVKKIVTGAAAIVIVLMVGYMLFGPAQRLDAVGEKAAHALAENDLSYFKSVAASGTEDDVSRWFDVVHSQLVKARDRWHGGKVEVVESHVGQEDRGESKGSLTLAIHHTLGQGIDLSLADPSAATASVDAPFDVDTEWTVGRWGRWQLDGRATYAKVKPSP
jgi:hypothetical protein